MKYRRASKNIKYLLYDNNIFDNSNLKSISHINKIDFILALIDININPKKYKYVKIRKTIRFWNYIKRDKNFSRLFGFKPETLKKYWYLIRNSGNICKFVEINMIFI